MTNPAPAAAAPKRGPGRPKKTDDSTPRRPRPKQTLKTLRVVGRDASPEARKLAAAVLEVLGGVRTTTDAAQAIGCSLPRYYQLEARAVEGLIAACAPVRRGPGVSPTRELEALKKKCARLEREVVRQQALVRAAHRTVGLVAAPAPEKPKPGKKRARRPKARALVAVAALEEKAAPPVTDQPPPVAPASS